MGRPRKATEEVFFDLFADWDAEDQAAALKVLEALHRQKTRRAKPKPEPEEPLLTLREGTNV